MTSRPYTIAVDFDDTCVTGDYPDIGAEIPYAVESLRRLSEYGISIILYTMREGDELSAALAWLANRSIPIYAVNSNPDPTWSLSRKVFADLYIDDRAVGIPKTDGHVDWKAIVQLTYEDFVRRGGRGLDPVMEAELEPGRE